TVALMNVGYVNIKMEKYDSAFVYLQRVLAMDPKNAYALSNISYVNLKLGKVQDALKNVNASLKLYPENSYAYRNRALIYIEMTNTDKACEDLHTAIRKGFTEEHGREVLDLIEANCEKKHKK